MQDKFLLCQGKGNGLIQNQSMLAKPVCSPCDRHWQCLHKGVPQNTQHWTAKTVAEICVYD